MESLIKTWIYLKIIFKWNFCFPAYFYYLLKNFYTFLKVTFHFIHFFIFIQSLYNFIKCILLYIFILFILYILYILILYIFKGYIITFVIVITNYCLYSYGFPGGAGGKEPACQRRRRKRHGFKPWLGKIPWRRAWQPTPEFLPGESHGQRSLVGHSPWSHKELAMTEVTEQTCTLGVFLVLWAYFRPDNLYLFLSAPYGSSPPLTDNH